MPLFTWDDSYSVKINLIDEHHKKLIDIINSLHEEMRRAKSNEFLGNTIIELLDYTNFHFGVEEKNMENFNYLEYQNHKAKHDVFVKKITDFQKMFSDDTKSQNQFKSGYVVVGIDVMDFLKNWLINHIKIEDQKYVPCFIKNGII